MREYPEGMSKTQAPPEASLKSKVAEVIKQQCTVGSLREQKIEYKNQGRKDVKASRMAFIFFGTKLVIPTVRRRALVFRWFCSRAACCGPGVLGRLMRTTCASLCVCVFLCLPRRKIESIQEVLKIND